MYRKQIVCWSFAVILAITSTFVMPIQQYAKSAGSNTWKKSVTVMQGKKKTVKLKKVKKKVKWKVIKGKNKIKICKKSGKYKNKIVIRGKKAGKAMIQAKVGKRTHKIKVVVKPKQPIELTTKQISAIETQTKVQDTTSEAAIEKYATVTFDCGGLAETETRKFKIGEPYGEFPEPQVDSYVYNGWYTKSHYGTLVKETDICTGDITLHACLIYLGGAVDEEQKTYWIDELE
ncbi:MAG: InlB B-repeat-containing protein [Eubacterium sp.]|nr:InlB B-repeat-containing protein [Eubacterium sp.]